MSSRFTRWFVVGSLAAFAPLVALGSLVGLVSMGAFGAGCTDDGAGGSGDASNDGIIVDPGRDGSGGDDGPDGAPQVSTTFRVAHVSPDLGAFDVCYRLATTTSWMGPLFAPATPPDAAAPPSDATSDAIALDAASSDASLLDTGSADGGDAAPPSVGVGFATVSGYVTIAGSGTFDVALVAAGETSCAHPRALGHITLDPGKHATVVVMGLSRGDAGADSSLAITGFADDTTLVSGVARARFIHAGLAGLGSSKATTLGAVSVDAVTGGVVVPLVGELLPGRASTASANAPKIDGLGYSNAMPMATASKLRTTQLADAGAQSWSTASYDLALTALSLHTAILFADADGALQILWCSDGGVGGRVTQCVVLPSS